MFCESLCKQSENNHHTGSRPEVHKDKGRLANFKLDMYFFMGKVTELYDQTL